MKLTDFDADDFDLREFVDPDTWDRFKDKCIWFFNPALFAIAQEIKDMITAKYGKNSFVINSWHYGGTRKWSGLRNQDFFKIYPKAAKYSQHLMGRAIDFKIFIGGKEIASDEIREMILEDERRFLNLGLTTLEDGKVAKNWVHADMRFHDSDEILIVGA
jgi:hypothetical protein